MSFRGGRSKPNYSRQSQGNGGSQRARSSREIRRQVGSSSTQNAGAPKNKCPRICGSSSGVVLRTFSRTLGLASLHRSNGRLKRLCVSPGGRTGDGAPGEPQASAEHAGPWCGKPGAGEGAAAGAVRWEESTLHDQPHRLPRCQVPDWMAGAFQVCPREKGEPLCAAWLHRASAPGAGSREGGQHPPTRPLGLNVTLMPICCP